MCKPTFLYKSMIHLNFNWQPERLRPFVSGYHTSNLTFWFLNPFLPIVDLFLCKWRVNGKYISSRPNGLSAKTQQFYSINGNSIKFNVITDILGNGRYMYSCVGKERKHFTKPHEKKQSSASVSFRSDENHSQRARAHPVRSFMHASPHTHHNPPPHTQMHHNQPRTPPVTLS